MKQERLKELFDYDAQLGLFKSKISNGKWIRGRICGTVGNTGYTIIYADGVRYLAHRLAWLYVYGCWPSNNIDHIDGNRCNNAICNLRDVPQKINMQNINKVSNNKKYSNLLGAQWCKQANKWKASIRIEGRIKHIGFFESDAEASSAYLKAKMARNGA